MCEPSPAAKVAAKLGLTGETLMDSTSCLLACRTFNDMTELEYSKASPVYKVQ